MTFPHQRLMHPSTSIPLLLSRQGRSKQGASQDCLHVPGRRPYAALSRGLESGSWGAPPRLTTSWLCDRGGLPHPRPARLLPYTVGHSTAPFLVLPWEPSQATEHTQGNAWAGGGFRNVTVERPEKSAINYTECASKIHQNLLWQ